MKTIDNELCLIKRIGKGNFGEVYLSQIVGKQGYFATKKIPLIYMQNSGIGNAINPLVSMADKDVYAIPMILLIGWRGQGNTEPNHPQHKLQGEITASLMDRRILS